MKKILIILLALSIGLIQSSCTDEGKFNNPVHFDLENGSFIRFAQDPGLSAAVDLLNFNGTFVNATVEDVNKNTSSYSITLTASVGGNNYVVDDFVVINSFPANLTITMQMIADAAGFDVNSVDFGDKFDFTSKATRQDGVVFYAINPSYDSDTQTVGIGNTDMSNLEKPGYRDAMQFDFIFACPSFEIDELVGTYGFTETGFTIHYNTNVEIVAGGTANEFVIKDLFGHGAEFGAEYGTTLVKVGSNGTDITIAKQLAFNGSDANNFAAAYGPGSIEGSGLVFSCLGKVVFDITPTVAAGSFGSRHYVLDKI